MLCENQVYFHEIKPVRIKEDDNDKLSRTKFRT